MKSPNVSAYLIPARGLKHDFSLDIVPGCNVSAYLIPARGLKLEQYQLLAVVEMVVGFRISNPRKGTETSKVD